VDRSVVSDVEANGRRMFWRTAQEPSLYLASVRPQARGERTYRLTRLRSFDEPIVVRLDPPASGEMRLSARRLSGEGGYGGGAVARTGILNWLWTARRPSPIKPP
jgi:hypothetical protein